MNRRRFLPALAAVVVAPVAALKAIGDRSAGTRGEGLLGTIGNGETLRGIQYRDENLEWARYGFRTLLSPEQAKVYRKLEAADSARALKALSTPFFTEV